MHSAHNGTDYGSIPCGLKGYLAESGLWRLS